MTTPESTASATAVPFQTDTVVIVAHAKQRMQHPRVHVDGVPLHGVRDAEIVKIEPYRPSTWSSYRPSPPDRYRLILTIPLGPDVAYHACFAGGAYDSAVDPAVEVPYLRSAIARLREHAASLPKGELSDWNRTVVDDELGSALDYLNNAAARLGLESP